MPLPPLLLRNIQAWVHSEGPPEVRLNALIKPESFHKGGLDRDSAWQSPVAWASKFGRAAETASLATQRSETSMQLQRDNPCRPVGAASGIGWAPPLFWYKFKAKKKMENVIVGRIA